MAIEPEDRYDSARALADDVTRWLDDEPVTAYREPVSVRAGRWMRRHRTAMIGAAAAGSGRADRAGRRGGRADPVQPGLEGGERKDLRP